MVKIGQKMKLPIEIDEEDAWKKKMAKKTMVEGVCIFVHPKGRFATFDFGSHRQCFRFDELEAAEAT